MINDRRYYSRQTRIFLGNKKWQRERLCSKGWWLFLDGALEEASARIVGEDVYSRDEEERNHLRLIKTRLSPG